MTHEIHHSFMEQKIIKRGALIMGAALVGGLVEGGRVLGERRRSTITGVKSYISDEGPSFLFFRGCGENYAAQAPLHARKLGYYGSLHFEYQTSGRHSQEMIDENIINACKLDGERDRVIVATSMGLMNAMRSLQNPEVREALGDNRLKGIISRSGITSKADLQPKMQQAAHISTQVPHLPIVGDAWRMHRLHKVAHNLTHSDLTTEEEVRLQHESSAYMLPGLVFSQYEEIDESESWQPGSHRMITAENPDLQLHHITAEYDDVADWRKTEQSLESAFELPVQTTVDSRRSRGSHAEDLGFIEPLADTMAMLSGRRYPVLAAVTNLDLYRHYRDTALAA